MDRKELATAIQKQYNIVFPKSYCNVSKGCLGDSYVIQCYLGNPDTWANQIRQNDQMMHSYWIHEPEDSDGKYTIECDNISLMINPIENYLAMSRIKIAWRKKKDTPEKLIKAMRKHFEQMNKIVYENIDNIYHVEELKEIL